MIWVCKQLFRMTNEKVKILVVGCGAVGSILATKLSKVACVTGYDIDSCVSSAVQRDGIKIYSNKKCFLSYNIPVFSKLTSIKNEHFDLVLIATKAYDTLAAVRAISTSVAFNQVLTIQNGLGNLEILSAYIKPSSIFCGVTTLAAQKIKPGITKLFYDGVFHLAPFHKNCNPMGDIKRLFLAAGFETHVTTNWEGMIWSKLIFNAVMNPLPVLVTEGYGMISRSPGIASFVHRAIREAKTVARKLGVRLVFDPEDIIVKIEKGGLRHLRHKGSMFDDISMGKKSEIDLLTGAVLKKAKATGVDTPILATLYALVKAIEVRPRDL